MNLLVQGDNIWVDGRKIMHVDFGRAGEEIFLQSNSSTGELLFWNK